MLTRSLIFPMHLLTLMTLPFYRNKNASSSVSLNKRFLPQMVLSSSEFTLPQAMLLLSILILLSDTANLLLPNFLPLRLRKISLRFVLIPHGRKLISCFSIHGLLASSTLTWSSFNQLPSLKNGFGLLELSRPSLSYPCPSPSLRLLRNLLVSPLVQPIRRPLSLPSLIMSRTMQSVLIKLNVFFKLQPERPMRLRLSCRKAAGLHYHHLDALLALLALLLHPRPSLAGMEKIITTSFHLISSRR